MRWPSTILGIGIVANLLAAVSLCAAEPSPEAAEFFEKEIRPLLVARCIECHGDGEKPEAGLRLTSREAILIGGESGPAAMPGKLESLLVEAVRYRSLEMPPKGKLPDAEIDKFVRWVEMGLPWPGDEAAVPAVASDQPFQITPEQQQFWSFQPVVAHAAPKVGHSSWPLNDVDRFVLAKLESQSLSPNPPAEKLTLLRRVTFDLIGLPPTPEEQASFLADESSDAFEKVVDRLLSSRHYGERWGRHWLDVVRYADTAGDVADYPVPQAYRYRNYVIDAFNADKPYDEFLREQIAGDLLAKTAPRNRYEELITATGYLAVTKRFGYNRHGDVHLMLADTLDTVGRSVLGLSIGCARCHDHKFDPISAADYYALYGIFASTVYPFPGAEEATRPADFVPLLPPDEAAPLQVAHEAELARISAEISRLKKTAATIQTQLAELEGAAGAFESHPLDAPPVAPWTSDGTVTVRADAQSPYQNAFASGQRGVRFPNDAANNGILYGFAPRSAGDAAKLHLNVDFRNLNDGGTSDGSYRICLCHKQNWSPAVEVYVNGEFIFLRNGDNLEQICAIAAGEWYNLQITVDLKSATYSGKIYGNKTAIEFVDRRFKPGWDGTLDGILVDAHEPTQKKRPAHDIDNFTVSDQPFLSATTAKPQPIAPPADVAERKSRLTDELTATQQALATARELHASKSNQPPLETVYAVFEGKPVNAQIHRRGEPARLGPEVPRRFLQILGGQVVPADEPGSGRRQLAEWLTSTDNPLTARVMVNRLWQHHFGRGLVDTPSDFGLRGHAPTHPELLDFLAVQFVKHGWSIKQLHKLMVLSQTYRMSSSDRADALAVDPANNLLWRMNRQRLDAESIRDAMLAVAGTLQLTSGGPHPFPPVHTWSFSVHNPFKAIYATNQRSVYLMTQRIQRHPFLALFDGPDPGVSTDQRILSTTPSQALFMMNDPFVHEQAHAAAQRILAQTSDESARVRLAYSLAVGREPTPQEAIAAAHFLRRYQDQLAHTNVSLAEQPLQAWSAYLRTILSSNEFLFLD